MKNELTRRLGLELPIVQGPFGGGFSTPQLVAAVSNAGGLGSLGAYHLAPEEILETAKAIRALTDRPFGLNLWISNHDPDLDRLDPAAVERLQGLLAPLYAELGITPPAPKRKVPQPFADQVAAILEARPAVFSFVFGIPSAETLHRARRSSITTAGAATTVDEAQALDHAGVDLIVASGFEAGGHRPSFLRPAEDSLTGTMALTAQISARFSRPVLAAGGIADARGVKAALALGALAAQVGTAFLACDESGAPPLHREMLFRKEAQHTVLSRAFSGRLARAIHNRIDETLEGADLLPFPAQSWMISTLHEAALEQNRPDLLAMWSGQAAGLLHHKKAADLVAALSEAF